MRLHIPWTQLASTVRQHKTSVGDLYISLKYKSPIEVLYCQTVDANGAHVTPIHASVPVSVSSCVLVRRCEFSSSTFVIMHPVCVVQQDRHCHISLV